jgi:Ser/Thr protein kinase RdoA (MazF antagonist)
VRCDLARGEGEKAEESMTAELEAVGGAFQIPGRFAGATPIKFGHIHDTFAATYREGEAARRYVHQRLNERVFRDIGALMDNLLRVTRHQLAALRAAGVSDAERRCLQLVLTREGRPFHVTAAGESWRTFRFLEGARSRNAIEEPAQAREVAVAFGRFAVALSDLPPPPLAITIPGFHDLGARFATFEEAVAADPHQRAASVSVEIDRAATRFQHLERRLGECGFDRLPRRIAHNDCKINNVMLDEVTGEGLCVIDLDTVMEGTVLCDFGELVRTATSHSPEDELNLPSMRFELPLFRAVTEGYLEGAAPLLREDELRILPLSGPVMALENAIRFLTDHLLGDVYFRIHREGHNLDRFRAQLRLAELMCEQREEMEVIVEEACCGDRSRAQGPSEA